MTTFVHESAYVDDGAHIGENTRIWHFCHVMDSAHIGDNCNLGQNVFVAAHVRIGNYVKIQNNVSVYEGVILEDYVFCGPSMVFTNVKTPRSAFPVASHEAYLETRVGRGSSIGANATIVCGSTLGEWCFVAAGSVITSDVPAYALMIGVPARQAGWMCRCGQRLTFSDDSAACQVCERSYIQTGETEIRFTGSDSFD